MRSGGSSVQVVAIECLKGSSKADEWSREMLQTGDIVEEVRTGAGSARSPFKGGRSALQKLLHAAYKREDTSVAVRVRRGTGEFVEMKACIVPNEAAGRRQYMLRTLDDPNYAVGLVDRTEEDCLELQGTKTARVANALCQAPLKDGYISYRWEKTMQERLLTPNSSSFLSIFIFPTISNPIGPLYNDLDNTLARANAWLVAAQTSGVPIAFVNVQTEPLLTKISGESASSSVNAGSPFELSNIANVGLYGFEDYHGVDIGVLRSVRLWYAPIAGEFPVEIELTEEDAMLGFSISRTEEGFIYISSVTEDDDGHPSASQRAGLCAFHKAAAMASKLLVVSRVSCEKVLPWMVSSSGAIRCFDTVSLSQKLSLHRHALKSILIHLFLWDRSLTSPSAKLSPPPPPPTPSPSPPSSQLFSPKNRSASSTSSQSFSPKHQASPPSSQFFSPKQLDSPPSSESFSPKKPPSPTRCTNPSAAGEKYVEGSPRLSKDSVGEFSFRMQDSFP